MGNFDKMFYSLVNGKVTLTGPVFMKDYDKDNEQTRYLEDLYARVRSRKRNLVKRDLILLRQGLAGEANVYFELKNSFLPMLILHDIRLEHEGYTAQYDFILITRQGIFVLETKKLNGDIEINADGDFVRSFRNGYGKLLKKEGMYSPVSQNQRHVKILREMLLANKLIRRMPVHSYVVLANPKTVLNKRHAPREIQSNILRYDQLAEVLKKQMSQAEKEINLLEKLLYPIADFLLANHKPVTYDLVDRYDITDLDFGLDHADSDPRDDELEALEAEAGIALGVSPAMPLLEATSPVLVRTAPLVTSDPPLTAPPNQPEVVEDDMANSSVVPEDEEKTRIHEELRAYRLSVSRAEGIKAYMVFTNEVLDELVERRPQTAEELLAIKGMGAVKVSKYGSGILPLLHR